jgi:hypothetical protein
MYMQSEQSETVRNTLEHLSGSKTVRTAQNRTFANGWNTLEHLKHFETGGT